MRKFICTATVFCGLCAALWGLAIILPIEVYYRWDVLLWTGSPHNFQTESLGGVLLGDMFAVICLSGLLCLSYWICHEFHKIFSR